MHNKKLEIIQQLMEELQEEMQYSGDDFSERLGRKKPDLEVVKIEGKMGAPDLEESEEEIGMDLDHDMEMGESPEHMAMVMGDEDENPENKFKKRIQALRG